MVFPCRVWSEIRSRAGEELGITIRGWMQDKVEPRFPYARPRVSEIASSCPAHRDVYLRRVRGLGGYAGDSLDLGVLVHEAFLGPLKLVGSGGGDVAGLYEWSVEWFKGLLARVVDGGAGDRVEIVRAAFAHGLMAALNAAESGIPVAVEPVLSGAALGVADARPDVIVANIPVEVVLASRGNGWVERKRLALAGYALIMESIWCVNVDFGVIVGIQVSGNSVRVRWRVETLGDKLRRRFLEERDRVAAIIETGEDPGLPASCPARCPFREVCGVARGGN